MDERPGLIGRVVAFLRLEVPAEGAEAFRRAGRLVDEMDTRLEQERLAAMVEYGHPMAFPRSVQTALLCGWNARALQDIGDALVRTDYERRPLTVGYLDPAVAELALLYYGQVPRWLSRAEQECPWSPVYLVKRPVKLGATTVHPLEQVTFDVGPVADWNKKKFVRRILEGPFFPDSDGPRWPQGHQWR